MKILITGGAGYIGAVTSRYLKDLGHTVHVYDHFVSHPESKLQSMADEPLAQGALTITRGGILDKKTLEKVLSQFHPDVVMHFAAYIQMGESVQNPRKYYDNNVIGSLSLIESMIHVGCHRLVFASSAGVYGNLSPAKALAKEGNNTIPENSCLEPTNPYGETKLVVERLLKWYDKAYGFKSISIRFFNAAGAAGNLGEDHHDESHIIPNILKAQGDDREFVLFGNDYSTPDGTCVRDYIHVLDLAEAFRLAAEMLVAGGNTTTYNAGTGVGYSNKQIVEMVEKVSGKPVKLSYAPRRPGDADTLVADVSRIKAELGWSPTHSDLETIIKDAYAWHSKK